MHIISTTNSFHTKHLTMDSIRFVCFCCSIFFIIIYSEFSDIKVDFDWWECVCPPKKQNKNKEEENEVDEVRIESMKYVKFWVANVYLCHFCQLDALLCVCVCAYVEFCLTWLTHSNNWCRLCTLVGFWTYWRRRWIQRWRNPTCEFKYLHYALVLLLMHPHSFYISIYRKCVSFSLTCTHSLVFVCACVYLWTHCANRKNIKDTHFYMSYIL